ncbi:4,5-dioxygenase [Robbsia andropogonis]|uniref:4,5-dioxygenase n=1 Tax=Robbsia andropogonis TaxID=28092 RepID=A0A0F5JVZ1_9BURK|nr:DOPA 4,5-dioxygenase family protein [Robbsia andropogonis]KKB61809.1 4,5-dioxygenase [Robbsia andropogonis]MCP1121077.1 DOPA 4,5-dioxygenase family protein [Robbsia andropogonis]MCP1130870.1 DOPA 4,5-dioxygenase family protein [Robbsia andropogonis]
MNDLSSSALSDSAIQVIKSWHAHVYFDETSRDTAWHLREKILKHLGNQLEMGRFHEKTVGPHPKWSYQLAFAPDHMAAIVSWLTLHHGELDVFVHPNTGDALRDHRDSPMWIGRSHTLHLAALDG